MNVPNIRVFISECNQHSTWAYISYILKEEYLYYYSKLKEEYLYYYSKLKEEYLYYYSKLYIR